MNWLKRLFSRCEHTFEVYESTILSRVSDGTTIGKMYVLRCTKCGDLKTRRATVGYE